MTKTQMNSVFDAVMNALANAGLQPEEAEDGSISIVVGDLPAKIDVTC